MPEETSLSTICTKRPVVQAKVLHRFNISYTAVSHSAFCIPCSGLASNLFPMALRSATSAISLFPMVLRSGTSRSATLHRRAAQKQLRSATSPSVSSRWCFATAPHGLPVFIGGPTRSNFAAASLPAVYSRWLSATVPLASCFRRLPVPAAPPRHPRPATNLIRRRRSPVWLAIWRTWAGFANSQHRDAAFATPDNICAHSSLLPHWAAAQTDANLSAHLHRLPTPPPYLRRMRLLPDRECTIGSKC